MRAAMPLRQILILEADSAATAPLCRALADAGHSVCTIVDAAAALTAVTGLQPHLVIIDRNMPQLPVADLIRATRGRHRAHRLMILSEFAAEDDIVTALDLGADDYVTKPYSVPEVAARVGALLRRPADRHREALCVGDLTLDVVSRRAMVRGRELNLRGMEYRLLEFIMSNAGSTLERAVLIAQVWRGSNVYERTVDVNVQRLRKHLARSGCGARIQTVRGFGYRIRET
jgi:DNA-binding response OmpR family regulator